VHPGTLDQRGVGGVTGDRHGARVRHVAEQRAERDDDLHAERFSEIDDVSGESTPAQRRLYALHEHDVARSSRCGGLEHLDARPDDLALIGVVELEARPVGLEVVELLGINPREAARVERGCEERDGARGSVPGVVPALERADHRRGPEAIGTTVPDERLHPNHRT
jgi:hypothetical protein